MNRPPIKLGVVGYGVGGWCFHTQFIEAATVVELAGVVTRSPVRRVEVAHDWPGVPVFDSLGTMIASGVESLETRRRVEVSLTAAPTLYA